MFFGTPFSATRKRPRALDLFTRMPYLTPLAMSLSTTGATFWLNVLTRSFMLLGNPSGRYSWLAENFIFDLQSFFGYIDIFFNF